MKKSRKNKVKVRAKRKAKRPTARPQHKGLPVAKRSKKRKSVKVKVRRRKGSGGGGGGGFGRRLSFIPAGGVPALLGGIGAIVAASMLVPKLTGKIAFFQTESGRFAQSALTGVGLFMALRRFSSPAALGAFVASMAVPVGALVLSKVNAPAGGTKGLGDGGEYDVIDAETGQPVPAFAAGAPAAAISNGGFSFSRR